MDSFLYFSFGSNMSSARIWKNNPSAIVVDTGRLADHALEFRGFYESWKGCTASIREQLGEEVLGVVWRVGNQHRETLDRQEGANYRRIEVSVTGSKGDVFNCLAYQRIAGDVGAPSPQYLNVILLGAREHNLPEHYIRDKLMTVQHNGYQGDDVTVP